MSFNRQIISKNPFWNTLFFLLAYLSFVRIQFIVWNWERLEKSEIGQLLDVIFIGVRFDLSATCFLMIPFLALSLIPRFSFLKTLRPLLIGFWLLICVLTLSLNVIDIEYSNFTGRRFGFHDLHILSDAQNKLSDYIKSYWLLSLINIPLLLAAWSQLYKLWWHTSQKTLKRSWINRLARWALALGVLMVGARGGFQPRPLALAHSAQFSDSFLNLAVSNTTFNVLKTYKDDFTRKEIYFKNQSEISLYLPSHTGPQTPLPQFATPQNVLVIVLESFAQEYDDYMPFLKSLSGKGLALPYGIANGKRSVDAIPAVTTGIPSLMDTALVFSPYINMELRSLPTLLRSKNYHSIFFHGGTNGTMHFDDFARRAQFDEYQGLNEYPYKGHHDGTWGIFDHHYFKYVGEHLSKTKKPFFSVLFSLSSHHPYKVPNEVEGKFREGSLPILKTIAYTDWSISQFFERYQNEEWFQNTLIVITADHTALHFRKSYENELGEYRVPMIFVHPQFPEISGETKRQPFQHIDLYPTILEFLGYRELNQNRLAQSLFSRGLRSATTYVSGRYVTFEENEILVWPPGQRPMSYNLENLTSLSETDSGAYRMLLKDTVSTKQLLRTKAHIQYFNESMNSGVFK